MISILQRVFFSACILLLSNISVSNSQDRGPDDPRPNIVMIIADDVRYDSFNQTGGPAFFDAPAIKRISDEGATFDNFYCVYSLCIPARASIFTGLYPHLNHAYDNTSAINPHAVTIATVLDSFGYHCGVIGKYHLAAPPQKGYQYWLATAGDITYNDPLMNYNGTFKQIFGNITDIISDSSARLISEIDTPFFVCIEHLAPHRQVKVQDQYEGIYDGETMPVPSTFYPFTKFYPSFLYDAPDKMYTDTADLSEDYVKYFEGLKGIDANVDSIFAILTSRGILENTMIIFTGDNGATYGDHQLKGKSVPYEPSMQLPLFIRYPKWFPQGDIRYSRSQFFSIGTDIMPSILDAALVNLSSFTFQGFSLKKLTSGSVMRDKFMFEKIKADTLSGGGGPEDEVTPSFRTIRTLHYKYTNYQCDHEVEEYFDLDIDSLETTNLIHNPDYHAAILAAQATLDSMDAVLLDTLLTTVDTIHRPCRLTKINRSIIIPSDTIVLKLSPNPAPDILTLNILSRSGENLAVTIFNELGEIVFRKSFAASGGLLLTDLNVKDLNPGIYFIRVQQGDLFTMQTLLRE
ncbi:MAG: sulfatase-like hydrolase/transferase [Chitinophagales bacterium]